MVRTHRIPRPLAPCGGEPFATAEEAWLWYVRCQMARDDGARFVAGQGDVPRPCDPDDIAREVRRLHLARALGPAHVRVLTRFGAGMTPPLPRVDGPAAALWAEALDRLATPLRHKGIVA